MGLSQSAEDPFENAGALFRSGNRFPREKRDFAQKDAVSVVEDRPADAFSRFHRRKQHPFRLDDGADLGRVPEEDAVRLASLDALTAPFSDPGQGTGTLILPASASVTAWHSGNAASYSAR